MIEVQVAIDQSRTTAFTSLFLLKAQRVCGAPCTADRRCRRQKLPTRDARLWIHFQLPWNVVVKRSGTQLFDFESLHKIVVDAHAQSGAVGDGNLAAGHRDRIDGQLMLQRIVPERVLHDERRR